MNQITFWGWPGAKYLFYTQNTWNPAKSYAPFHAESGFLRILGPIEGKAGKIKCELVLAQPNGWLLRIPCWIPVCLIIDRHSFEQVSQVSKRANWTTRRNPSPSEHETRPLWPDPQPLVLLLSPDLNGGSSLAPFEGCHLTFLADRVYTLKQTDDGPALHYTMAMSTTNTPEMTHHLEGHLKKLQ